MREYSNSICGNESNDSDSSSDITDITIIAGVFFDGTKNNKYNVDFGEMGQIYTPQIKKITKNIESSKTIQMQSIMSAIEIVPKQILQNFGICMILQRYQIALRCILRDLGRKVPLYPRVLNHIVMKTEWFRAEKTTL